MTLFLGPDDIVALGTHQVTMDAATAAAAAEGSGRAIAPPRLDVDLASGFLRVMPGCVDDVMGLKVMTNVDGLGNRYLLLVYRQSDGDLLAILDADEITRLRTAATTAVAARILQPEPQSDLGLIGSGFEATGHLRAMAHLWPLRRVVVHSPSAERRETFATRMSDELGLDVQPVATSGEACRAARTVVLATKARRPVLDGDDLAPGTVVLSIGSTRPDLRELDRRTLQRTAVLLVDDTRGVTLESGDVIDALAAGALPADALMSMGVALAGQARRRPEGDRDLLTFKSVGTAIQDLALAAALVGRAHEAGLGRDLGELTRLKRFAAVAQP